MQKQYKHAYLTLTRHNPLPMNCLPFSARKRGAQSLTELLHLNQTIMNMVDPNFTTVIGHKRKSHAHFNHIDKVDQTANKSPKRIHPNAAILMASVRNKSRKNKFMSMQVNQAQENETKAIKIKRRTDLYDDQIQKFMSSKYARDVIIQQYLNNKEQFVRMACEQIQNEIKQNYPLKRSMERLKDKKSQKKLPKIEQFSFQLKKSTHRAKPAEYLKSITHLKKAQTLELKQRQRKQRVFRHKINSLECRLDKIRDDSTG